MSFLEALSGIGGSVGSGLETGYAAQAARMKRQQMQDEQAGNVLFGQTLQLLGGGQPTQPQGNGILDHIKRLLGGGQQPQAIPPGMSQGQPPQQGGPPPNLMEGVMKAAPPGGGGMPPQAPQTQMQPMPQPQAAPQPQGQLDWRQIAAKVQQTNPKAPPQVVAAAVNQFLPLMSQQAQNEWKQIQLQISQQRANEAETYHQDLVGQRRDAADAASADRSAALDQKKVEAQSKEFERTSTAYEKLSAAIAGDPKLDTPANQALVTKLQEKMATMAGVPPAELPAAMQTKGPEQSWSQWFKENLASVAAPASGGQTQAEAAAKGTPPAASAPDASQPPAGAPQGTKKAPDGKWYAPDPKSPSGWSEVVQ